VYADAALQYDPGDQQFERYALGARYLPAPGKVLNAIYSYNTDAAIPIKQVDFSGQWPISGRWQAVGRYNYSFLQNQPIEIIGGLEYNAGCWAVRTVAHRLQTTEADCDDAVLRATSIEWSGEPWLESPESSPAPDSGIRSDRRRWTRVWLNGRFNR
jgi:lipopolysaccharide assembly outer membrane protein LptD (OstA)